MVLSDPVSRQRKGKASEASERVNSPAALTMTRPVTETQMKKICLREGISLRKRTPNKVVRMGLAA